MSWSSMILGMSQASKRLRHTMSELLPLAPFSGVRMCPSQWNGINYLWCEAIFPRLFWRWNQLLYRCTITMLWRYFCVSTSPILNRWPDWNFSAVFFTWFPYHRMNSGSWSSPGFPPSDVLTNRELWYVALTRCLSAQILSVQRRIYAHSTAQWVYKMSFL